MKVKLALSMLSVLLVAANSSSAAFVTIQSVVDDPSCDVLVPHPSYYDEQGMGDFSFPVGEQIAASSTSTTLSACAAVDNPLLGNRLVWITNMNDFSLSGLYFVANGGNGVDINAGTFSNFDGYMNGSMAMMIDKVGSNKPLIYESMTQDSIFEPGETWRFIVQDWVSSAGASAFGSAGQVGQVDNDYLPSIVVPEPSGLALSLLGGLMLIRRRR